MSPDTPPTVVLVHGAWADGSSWSRVITELDRAGIAVTAAPIPLTSLPDDVNALNRAIDRTAGPVVLAGHAYAGAVIASVSHEKVASLVYVTALAPDEGETVSDVFYRAEPHPQAPALAPDRHGQIWLPEEAFAAAFAQHATALEQALLAATQRPLAVDCIGIPVPRPAWKERPSWFLVAEEDRMIPAQTQRFMAERMNAHVRTAPTDHMPMLTAPPAVVDIVLDAVREAGSQGTGELS
jgi:pimeloyl-ACP methyl ester carboxylesterase